MKKLILAIMPALLLLLLPASIQAQDAREGTLGIRLDGGLSWSLGGDFANSGNNALTLIQPQGVVGLFYNFSSRFRMGLDYGYTRMVREQTNGTMNALPGGGVAGEVYRNLKDNEIVGLTLSLPVFDWGVSKGRVKMAQADLEVTKTQLEQAHESYVQDLQTSVFQFNMQADQCKNAMRAQDIADERYDITKRRFETGAVTVTDLNTAQQESENARAQYIRQLQTFWTGYYSLRQSTLYDWINHQELTVDFNDVINNKN